MPVKVSSQFRPTTFLPEKKKQAKFGKQSSRPASSLSSRPITPEPAKRLSKQETFAMTNGKIVSEDNDFRMGPSLIRKDPELTNGSTSALALAKALVAEAKEKVIQNGVVAELVIQEICPFSDDEDEEDLRHFAAMCAKQVEVLDVFDMKPFVEDCGNFVCGNKVAPRRNVLEGLGDFNFKDVKAIEFVEDEQHVPEPVLTGAERVKMIISKKERMHEPLIENDTQLPTEQAVNCSPSTPVLPIDVEEAKEDGVKSILEDLSRIDFHNISAFEFDKDRPVEPEARNPAPNLPYKERPPIVSFDIPKFAPPAPVTPTRLPSLEVSEVQKDGVRSLLEGLCQLDFHDARELDFEKDVPVEPRESVLVQMMHPAKHTERPRAAILEFSKPEMLVPASVSFSPLPVVEVNEAKEGGVRSVLGNLSSMDFHQLRELDFEKDYPVEPEVPTLCRIMNPEKLSQRQRPPILNFDVPKSTIDTSTPIPSALAPVVQVDDVKEDGVKSILEDLSFMDFSAVRSLEFEKDHLIEPEIPAVVQMMHPIERKETRPLDIHDLVVHKENCVSSVTSPVPVAQAEIGEGVVFEPLQLTADEAKEGGMRSILEDLNVLDFMNVREIEFEKDCPVETETSTHSFIAGREAPKRALKSTKDSSIPIFISNDSLAEQTESVIKFGKDQPLLNVDIVEKVNDTMKAFETVPSDPATVDFLPVLPMQTSEAQNDEASSVLGTPIWLAFKNDEDIVYDEEVSTHCSFPDAVNCDNVYEIGFESTRGVENDEEASTHMPLVLERSALRKSPTGFFEQIEISPVFEPLLPSEVAEVQNGGVRSILGDLSRMDFRNVREIKFDKDCPVDPDEELSTHRSIEAFKNPKPRPPIESFDTSPKQLFSEQSATDYVPLLPVEVTSVQDNGVRDVLDDLSRLDFKRAQVLEFEKLGGKSAHDKVLSTTSEAARRTDYNPLPLLPMDQQVQGPIHQLHAKHLSNTKSTDLSRIDSGFLEDFHQEQEIQYTQAETKISSSRYISSSLSSESDFLEIKPKRANKQFSDPQFEIADSTRHEAPLPDTGKVVTPTFSSHPVPKEPFFASVVRWLFRRSTPTHVSVSPTNDFSGDEAPMSPSATIRNTTDKEKTRILSTISGSANPRPNSTTSSLRLEDQYVVNLDQAICDETNNGFNSVHWGFCTSEQKPIVVKVVDCQKRSKGWQVWKFDHQEQMLMAEKLAKQSRHTKTVLSDSKTYFIIDDPSSVQQYAAKYSSVGMMNATSLGIMAN